jgi:hypothetical protein
VDDQERPAKADLAIRLAELAVYAAGMWMMLPEAQRQEIVMRATMGLHRLSGRLARRAAARSMETELRTGHARYELPWLLSVLRDQAARLYERERSA